MLLVHRKTLWFTLVAGTLGRKDESRIENGRKKEMEKAAKAAPAKLPELKITPFNGTPVDWIRFQNIFTSQTHDKPLSDEEKYGYLLELVALR